MVDCMEVKSLAKQIGDTFRTIKSEGKKPVFAGYKAGQCAYPTNMDCLSYPKGA